MHHLPTSIAPMDVLGARRHASEVNVLIMWQFEVEMHGDEHSVFVIFRDGLGMRKMHRMGCSSLLRHL